MAAQGTLEFRKDINGLRAYAVIAVLLYHFGIPGMGGGYAGVDVFFVISGFLMTAIILPRVESNCFSLSGFYLARVRRILPALAVLCLTLLVFGWFWLAPYLYENLGKSAGASLLFISNFVYNRGGGYFGELAHDNWLLHTWSLSVEWQFYLLYPLLLLGVLRLSGRDRRLVHSVLLGTFIASFAYAIWLTSAKPTSAFFMLPARAWELLAGGLAYLHSGIAISQRTGRALEAAGLMLIVVACIAYDSSTPWPGHYAAVPVLGAYMILIAAHQASPWTGNRIAQGLGRWSYSVYLWHWPLVVGLGYFGARDEITWMLAAMVASIVLGALSYRFVEQPSARWMRNLGRAASWRAAGAGFALTFGFAAVVYFDQGVGRTLRLPEEVLIAASEKENSGWLTKCNTAESQCVLGSGKTLAIVWGDSHAIATVSGVAASAGQASGSILFFGQQACPVIFGGRSSNVRAPDFCKNFNDMVFDRLREINPATPVIVIHRAGTYIEPGDRQIYFEDVRPTDPAARRLIYERRLVDSLCRIAASRPLYVVLPIPEMPYDVPAVVSQGLIIDGTPPSVETSLRSYEQANASMLKALQETSERCGVRLLDPVPYLCTDESCDGLLNGRPLYSDDNHPSKFGASRLAPMFAEVWRERQ